MPNLLFQIPDISKPVKDAAHSWFDSPQKLIENPASLNMLYLIAHQRICFLYQMKGFLCITESSRMLLPLSTCPRRGPKLGPATLTTLAARALSPCLCAMSTVYLLDLRLIGTQELAPPWLLHVTGFRHRQEIATAQKDCLLLPGASGSLSGVSFSSEHRSPISCTPQCSSLDAQLRLGLWNWVMAGTGTGHTPQDSVAWDQWTSSHLGAFCPVGGHAAPEKQCPVGAAFDPWLAELGVLRLRFLSLRDATAHWHSEFPKGINFHLPTMETNTIIALPHWLASLSCSPHHAWRVFPKFNLYLLCFFVFF